ncbi:MAG: cyclic nucleotide-binding domain-containing protein [Alphaproteobacteria bacterium]|nr:cyclic nucleotide-binding domain-containing protein [Alphaproteobacteria bacterium]
MNRSRLYDLLRPGASGSSARIFRAMHHAMVAAGVTVMLVDTVEAWRQVYGVLFENVFHLISAFFVAEFAVRLVAAPGAPGAELRPAWRARLAWIVSAGGLLDFLGTLPGLLNLVFETRDAILFGLIWVFKLVRYAPGLLRLRRAIGNARQALLSVLLGFLVVLLAASSLEYLIERGAQPDAFGSIPAALWWGIVTMTNAGYGDTVPHTIPGRMLAGVVMVCGIVTLALSAGILATGFAQEMRRHAFLRTWNIVAEVPFFQTIGASIIAEVARLLRPRDYQAGAVIVRRGEAGDCMYFIASGEVEIDVKPERLRLGAGEFFGEIALLTGAPRIATVVATQPCTLLRLDIVEFRELMGRHPELARVIYDAAHERLGASSDKQLRHHDVALDFGPSL